MFLLTLAVGTSESFVTDTAVASHIFQDTDSFVLTRTWITVIHCIVRQKWSVLTEFELIKQIIRDLLSHRISLQVKGCLLVIVYSTRKCWGKYQNIAGNFWCVFVWREHAYNFDRRTPVRLVNHVLASNK